MALLQCEICGGKLTGRAGGIYECEFCGMQYDTSWAKAKIQEIKGTVQVEGTVEVQGTVKIEGPVKVEGGASAETLLKRAQMALEDGQSKAAKDSFEKVLSMEPNCAEAYFGLAMIDAHVNHLEALVDTGEWENHNYRRGKQFAESTLLAQVERFEQAFYAKRKQEEALRIQAEEQRVHEKRARTERLKPLMERSRKAEKLLSAGGYFTAAVNLESQILLSSTTISWEKRYFREPDEIGATVYWSVDRRLIPINDNMVVYDWQDIVAISAGDMHIVGLTSDGHVVASGSKRSGECKVNDWQNIVAVSAGGCYERSHTVGLTADGRVVAVGSNAYGQCNVSSWRDIQAVSAGENYTVGLTADGRVVATGSGSYGKCDVSGWRDIVAVSAGSEHTVGLTSDGRVVVTKCEDAFYASKYNVDDWRDIVAVSAGGNHTVGLTADGRVLAVGNNDCGQCDMSDWRNIVAVSAGSNHTVGLTADGRVRTAGDSTCGLCNVNQWKLFKDLDNRQEEKKALLIERAEKKCSDEYRRGCSYLDMKQSERMLLKAKAIFVELSDYRDAQRKILDCDAAIQELQQNEKRYSDACRKINCITMQNMTKAKSAFDELGLWKDSRKKAAWCEEKIKILQEISQKKEERKAFEREQETLGIFALKRKKEITSEIQRIDKELDRLEKEKVKK